MKATLWIRMWSILPVVLLVSCGGADQAKVGVTEFRERVAQRSFVDIYRTAAPEFRQATTEPQFVKFMTAVDRKLGSWQFSADPTWNVTRGTGGHLVRLTYQSDFARGAATEQFAWRIENGAAVLLGYNISSSLLVTE